MTREFVFRLGPLPSHPRERMYLVFPGRKDRQLFVADNDESGLRKVIAEFGADNVESEPAIADSAARLGVAVGVLTPQRVQAIATVVLDLAFPKHFAKVKSDGLILELCRASAEYWHHSPWRYRFARRPLEANLLGSVYRELQAYIVGTGDDDRMVVLAPESTPLHATGAKNGRANSEAAGIDALSVAFARKPAFAVDAMQRLVSVPIVPFPTKVESGTRNPINDDDLLLLAAALHALSELTDEHLDATAHVTVGELEEWAVVRPGGPSPPDHSAAAT